MPGLNDAMDGFIAHALRHNLPLELHNHPEGPHAFDLYDDSKASRRLVRRILGFLGEHLESTGAIVP